MDKDYTGCGNGMINVFNMYLSTNKYLLAVMLSLLTKIEILLKYPRYLYLCGYAHSKI